MSENATVAPEISLDEQIDYMKACRKGHDLHGTRKGIRAVQRQRGGGQYDAILVEIHRENALLDAVIASLESLV